MSFPTEVIKAHQEALRVLKNSYAPYSKLHVACALKIGKSDQVIVGVNVENASFGGTICAERSAILSAISQWGPQCQFQFAVVISDFADGPIPPCGMCLQVFNEFVAPDFPIYLGDSKELKNQHCLKDFLPLAFSSDQLPS